MKSSRLFEILLLLLDKRKITAVELSNIFQVSVRTIYRDIDSLSSAGIPVYTTTGKNGGVHLMDDFIIDKSLVSQKDKDDIMFALNSLSTVPNLNKSDAAHKISVLFSQDNSQESTEWLKVDFSQWKSSSESSKTLFEDIKNSIICKKSVEIHYAGTNFEESVRVMDPIKLVFKHRDWYVFGFCKSKNSFRMFKMNRIIQCKVLKTPSDTYTDYPKMYENNYVNYDALCEVEILFSVASAFKVYETFDRENLSRYNSDMLLLSGSVEINDWLISTLMSFGDKVTVLSPPHLKDALITSHKSALASLISSP